MKKMIWLAIALIAMSYCVYAQETMTLDEALQAANRYLEERLQPGSKVVLLNFQTEYLDLSNYIIDELTTYVVNGGIITAVDRQNMELIRQEMNFQISGEVSDESAQAIGRKLGAQSIISGSIQRLGAVYRLRVRAISVETAAIQGMQNYNVKTDAVLASLMGGEHVETTASTPPPARKRETPSKPVKQTAGNEWKNKIWYLGVLTGYGSDFTFLATADLFLLKNIGLGVEFGWQGCYYAEYSYDYYYDSKDSYYLYESVFTLNALAKLLFRPGKVELGIFAGPAINGRFWLTFGGEFGVNVGPGILFLDVRVSGFNGSGSIDIGYKVGIGNR
ncbi:MAG: penicillin-binding protein activator LpoB [Treponema sp.]|jgi:TolB-like protein|nr:penicillin-binding protein activator LpoB [Treponema sp.]